MNKQEINPAAQTEIESVNAVMLKQETSEQPTAVISSILKWLGDTVHYNLFEHPWHN
jgi:hypothetical protein